MPSNQPSTIPTFSSPPVTRTSSTSIPLPLAIPAATRGSSPIKCAKSEITTIRPPSPRYLIPSRIARERSASPARGERSKRALDALSFGDSRSTTTGILPARIIVFFFDKNLSASSFAESNRPSDCILAETSNTITVCPPPTSSSPRTKGSPTASASNNRTSN